MLEIAAMFPTQVLFVHPVPVARLTFSCVDNFATAVFALVNADAQLPVGA